MSSDIQERLESISEEENLENKIDLLIVKARTFYISFILLNLVSNILRFLVPNFNETGGQKVITLIYAPLQLICFILELSVISHFYKTSNKFSHTLSAHENINIKFAKFCFGFVSFVLLTGKFDYYITQTLIQIDAVFYDFEYCENITDVSIVTRYPHNLMPIFIGLVMLKFVHFMSVTAERIESDEDE